MKKLVEGVLNFRKNIYPVNKDLFGSLATGQNPDILFITCSDSRIDPNMLTGTHPGDLFICRNAGNIVPPHSNETGGMTASIEFAVAVLNVRHIIICGHTDCGAIKGALDLSALNGLPHVVEWLSHCRSAMEIVRERNNIPHDHSIDSGYMNEAIEENVLQQVQHIRTHPAVAAKLATNKIELHGWIYNIKTGGVICCSNNQTNFTDIEDAYKDIVENLSD